MAAFVVVSGSGVGTRYVLSESKQRIGRDSRCEIHLDDTETSRKHAEIEFAKGEYSLTDLKSSNGTIVNGKVIQSKVLCDGDRIQIGKFLFVFRLRESNPSSTDKDYLTQSIAIVPDGAMDSSQIRSRADLSDPVGETEFFDPETANPLSVNKSQWEIMYRTSLAVSRTLDINQLLEQIVDLIFQWVQCDHACVMLQDASTGALNPVYRKNRKIQSNHQITISKTILDYVLSKEEGVLTSNAKEDRRWNSSASIEASGVCEAICVPMRGRYGVVGVLYIDTIVSATKQSKHSELNVFNDEHLKMMVTIGHQAALAIEDTRFYQSTLQSEKLAAVGQTIANLSHHVKNILQGLRGGGYMVNEGLKSQNVDTIRSGWEISEKIHGRIESLVLDMLTMSKERKPKLQSIDLVQLIQDVLAIAKTSATDAKVELTWQPAESIENVSVDPEGIHHALLNLVLNAIDATGGRPDAKVLVKATQDPTSTQIVIEDNGIGIPKSQLTTIFSLFESTKGNRGTGLGLPVSQKIVREHGGEISVSSIVDQGTTFTISLPNSNND
ncbi:MAG: ATP-binding protein [Planctomycetota bacterium]|jgi:signal transduction histidine kinase/pSer/pThr/pTyr-binding forkhead associated (FHA) protein